MTRLALAPPVPDKLGPLERIEALCDPGSIQLVRGEVVSRRMGGRTSPGDGVVGATGTVDGRSIACFAQDASYLGGSLGEAQADTILLLAWPRAQMGVMGARQAVDLVHRREIPAADEPGRARDRLADGYAAEHLTAASAAAEGVIDEIVAPSATRPRLASALRMLSTPARPVRPARNIPL